MDEAPRYERGTERSMQVRVLQGTLVKLIMLSCELADVEVETAIQDLPGSTERDVIRFVTSLHVRGGLRAVRGALARLRVLGKIRSTGRNPDGTLDHVRYWP